MSNLAFSYQDTLIEAGCDEAGRGCLAGPVFAAAVILDPKMDLSELNDSKKLSAKKREELREIIEEGALAWAVAQLSPAEIDKHNILQASFLAMHRALDQLTTTAELLLIDGNRFRPYKEIPHHCMIKGDGRFLSIAAASILAKTHRDEYMLEQAKKYPEYGWKSNKGYPTKAHRAAIAQYGATPLHRKSFRLLPEAEQKKLSFED
ncbi:ribonuclease HII [Saprospira sp. CCB-QB6]|uniref:ribonuclease HII n=1 Tax=Saprospira sp. CCB-QB6 TaxID=3023936 RepID=UPI00234B25E2|nr:ribonuclease HII [Saprospira sp. CCB-QB6]WCL80289.1 ribonuclease HII [Saprospira sp. CCB-QB6]